MDNYDKYIKYKKKYIELKNNVYSKQRGGAIFPVTDEIHFWGRQMTEHALFLYLGLEEKSLKNKAFEIHTVWKDFMNKNFYNKGIKVNMETIFLSEEDISKTGQIDITKLNDDLLDPLISFKSQIVDVLDTGKWIGWIYPSLAQHMVTEGLYFKRKINGPEFTPNEEISFANEHHGEEIGVTAQLIDPNPTQQRIIDIARSYAMKAMSKVQNDNVLSDRPPTPEPFPKIWTKEDEAFLKGFSPMEQEKMLEISIRYGDELTQFAADTGQKIEANQLKSVISPVLAKHVFREFVRFTETLRALRI